MEDILSRIVDVKKKEVECLKANAGENRFDESIKQRDAYRGFFKKLSVPGPSGINIISEIKRASPSKGLIDGNLDPVLQASQYESGGAAALSVLTDIQFFKGSFDDLRKARKSVSLPVLRKDFIISASQVYESAALGADAVLLIARILSKEKLKSLLDLCGELGIDALVEVHSKEELENATWAGAVLVGINNRNLRTFKTSIETAIRMVPYLEKNQVAVAESGIKSRDDILRLKDAGIFNFLIGESLVRAENPSDFLASLMK